MTRPIYWADGPMTKERKAELVAQGYRIVDIRFKPAEPIAVAEPVEPVEKPKRTYKRKAAK